MQSRNLGDKILTAFKEAYRGGHPDTAEHLLRALETLGRTPRPRSALGRAYLTISWNGSGKKSWRHLRVSKR
jgi:hypothetical protein